MNTKQEGYRRASLLSRFAGIHEALVDADKPLTIEVVREWSKAVRLDAEDTQRLIDALGFEAKS